MKKNIQILFYIISCLFAVGTACCLIVRVYCCDQFVVPSRSMYPTLLEGDRILVNKHIFGPRIYDKCDFDEGKLQVHRLKGRRQIQYKDVVVFNFPLNKERNRIKFKINYVFVKRCIGLPGDTILLENRRLYNTNYTQVLGYNSIQDLPNDNVFALEDTHLYEDRSVLHFDRLWIPKAGDTITLNVQAVKLYKLYIEWESESSLQQKEDGSFYLGETKIDMYVFKHNYYFMYGDNSLISYDSRQWGLLPEDFIIGVATRILYSRSPYSGNLSLKRFLKKII